MNRLISLALRQRVLAVIAFIALLFGGAIMFQRLNIEAYPDPTPPMVDVVMVIPCA